MLKSISQLHDDIVRFSQLLLLLLFDRLRFCDKPFSFCDGWMPITGFCCFVAETLNCSAEDVRVGRLIQEMETSKVTLARRRHLILGKSPLVYWNASQQFQFLPMGRRIVVVFFHVLIVFVLVIYMFFRPNVLVQAS